MTLLELLGNVQKKYFPRPVTIDIDFLGCELPESVYAIEKVGCDASLLCRGGRRIFQEELTAEQIDKLKCRL